MSSSQFTEGTAIWLKDDKFCWLKAFVKESDQLNGKKFVLKCQMDDINCGPFEVREVDFSDNEAPHLRNTTLNEDRLDDLTNLSYLNEPAVLNTIHCRYQDSVIYTYSGLVLVSLNPYCDLGLYEDTLIQAYSGKSRGELEPHLFAIAEDAFRSMQRERKNQSIIISGESGAGKTISARYVMRYFASAANSHLSRDSTKIESRVLASNPILEAFGNAKTNRNDNSSRFGKYVQIFFDKKDEITGAAIKTYLLEKTRVVKQSKGERNYHIFYQLIEGSGDSLKKELFLDSKRWKDFQYLNVAGSIENVNDSDEFEATVESLKIAGFNEETQLTIFKILSAILHLGNIKFESDGEDSAILSSENEENLKKITKLLNSTEKEEELARWLTKKQFVTKLDTVEMNLTVAQAEAARDAVAKFLYSKVFDFIVKKLNNLLEPPSATATGAALKFIGVLDIYGFEKFDQNSFEQFCINYANEKLQHEFNQQVFKLEQELYEREEIEWSFINFSDNQPCINLIEARGGILDLLDEECRFPNGGDESFLDKIKVEIPKRGADISGYLGKDPLEPVGTFTIKHFAYDVNYCVDGFLEKNRDLIPTEVVQFLESMECTESDFSISSTNISKTSTGSSFRESLSDLMKIIQSTQVHYIRCIKPNNSKAPMTFEANFVMQQLCAGGIIETIKISAAGYPARWSFEEFYSRYRILSKSLGSSSDIMSREFRELSRDLLKGQVEYLKEGEYQIGKSQIFLRSGILAKLERIRAQILKDSATCIQSRLRGIWSMKRVKNQFDQIILIQSAFKARRCGNLVQEMKKNHSATLLQSVFTYYQANSSIKRKFEAIRLIQVQFKSQFRQTAYMEDLRHRMVVRIQRTYRSKKADLIKNIKDYSAKQIQNLFKSAVAHRKLKELRVEAKSFEKLQETSFGLEKKVIELTRELEEMSLKNLTDKGQEIKSLLDQIEVKDHEIKDKDEQLCATELRIKDLETQIESLKRSAAETESLHKVSLDQIKSKYEGQLNKHSESNGSVQEKYEELLESKRKLELKFAKVERYVRTLMANQIKTTKDHESESIEPESVEVVDRMGSNNSLFNFISEEDESKLVKFTSSTEILEDLLKSKSILNELNEMIESVDLNSEFEAGNEVMRPAKIIYSWLNISLILPRLNELTESRMNHLLETIRGNLSESTDDVKCSYWLTNLIQLYGMIHHFVIEKEEEIKRNHSKMLEGTSEIADYCDTAHANMTKLSPTLTVTTQISMSELPPAIILLVRAEVMRLIGDIYTAWLRELCRWFGKAGVSGILEHQPLSNYKVKSSSVKERKRSLVETVFTTLIREKPTESQGTVSINDLLAALDALLEAFLQTTLDLEISQNILVIIFSHVSGVCFNQLLLKRSFISWKRAIQIQFNLSRLEDWIRDRLEVFGVEEEVVLAFNPLLQAVKVIQLAKTRGVDSGVLQQCAPNLTPLQIRKLLTSYVPDEFEDGPVPLNLIRQFPAGTNPSNNTVLLSQIDLNKISFPLHLKERNPPNVAGMTTELPIDIPPTLWKLFLLYLK